MLTSNDLSQIRDIVEDVVETKLEQKLKPVNKKLNKLQKDLDSTIDLFDNDIFKTKERVTRIETVLHLTH